MGKNKHKRKKPAGYNKKSLANSILGIFSNNPRKTFNYKQIAKYLLIKSSAEKRLITEVLQELVRSNDLDEVFPGKFKLKSSVGHVIGKVDIAQGGYGFVSSESMADDIFISQKNLMDRLVL